MFHLRYDTPTVTGVDVHVSVDPAADLDPKASWEIRGPYSTKGRTLPARFPLRPLSSNQWQGTIVDPCFWGPGAPFLYRLHASTDATPVATQRPAFEFGIRNLQINAGQLWLDGKRWVLRGATTNSPDPQLIQTYQDELLCPIVREWDAPFLHACSLQGTPFVWLLDRSDQSGWRETLTSRPLLAALVAIILPAEAEITRQELSQLAPNRVIIADIKTSHQAAAQAGSWPDWCDAVCVPANRMNVMESILATAGHGPVIAWKPKQETDTTEKVEHASDVHRLRRECEKLQASLAPRFHVSGYLVR